MYRIIYFLCVLFFVPLFSLAQNDFPGEVPTPQAADLGRYGDVPVSLYTGTTYMVGNNKHNTIISFLWGSAVSPMRQSVNGKTKGFRYQHERR